MDGTFPRIMSPHNLWSTFNASLSRPTCQVSVINQIFIDLFRFNEVDKKLLSLRGWELSIQFIFPVNHQNLDLILFWKFPQLLFSKEYIEKKGNSKKSIRIFNKKTYIESGYYFWFPKVKDTYVSQEKASTIAISIMKSVFIFWYLKYNNVIFDYFIRKCHDFVNY